MHKRKNNSLKNISDLYRIPALDSRMASMQKDGCSMDSLRIIAVILKKVRNQLKCSKKEIDTNP